MPKPKELKPISYQTDELYDKILELIKYAGSYAAKVKLRENLSDPSTAWEVQGVLDRYYEGNMDVLCNKIDYYCTEVKRRIRELNILNRNHGIREIIKPDSLINLLLDETRRRKYRQFAEKHRKKDEIVDLRIIEAEFREWRKKNERI